MVNIIYECKLWPKQSFNKLFKEILHVKACEMCNISVLLTDDIAMAELNNKFRHINSTTNVLSFPQFDYKQNIKKYDYLGDLAMSYGTVCKEANLYHVSFNHHTAHLFVHGVLHLLGMDHINPQERLEMEKLEVQVLAKFNISNPYI